MSASADMWRAAAVAAIATISVLLITMVSGCSSSTPATAGVDVDAGAQEVTPAADTKSDASSVPDVVGERSDEGGRPDSADAGVGDVDVPEAAAAVDADVDAGDAGDTKPPPGTCFPNGVEAPATLTVTPCPTGPDSTCVYRENTPTGSTLQLFGCLEGAGHCVQSCSSDGGGQ